MLAYLCGFLGQVAKHSSQNLMGLANLATVFGPNILSPKVASALELMEHTPIICGVFEYMVAQEAILFAVPYSFPSSLSFQSLSTTTPNNNFY